MRRKRPDGGQKHFRRDRLRPLAQSLERLGETLGKRAGRRNVRQHGDGIGGEVGMRADARQRRFGAGGVAAQTCGGCGNLLLDEALLESRRQPAGRLLSLEQRPGFSAQVVRQRFEAAGARCRVGDDAEPRLAHSTSCVLRASRRAKASGRPSA